MLQLKRFKTKEVLLEVIKSLNSLRKELLENQVLMSFMDSREALRILIYGTNLCCKNVMLSKP